MDIPDRTAGENVPELQIVIHFFTPCSLGPFHEPGSIIWMDALNKCFACRQAALWVKAQHAEALLGPVPQPIVVEGPCPTARMTQLLRLRQIDLVLAELFFR